MISHISFCYINFYFNFMFTREYTLSNFSPANLLSQILLPGNKIYDKKSAVNGFTSLLPLRRE